MGHEVHVVSDKPFQIEGAASHPVKLYRKEQAFVVRAFKQALRTRQAIRVLRDIKPDIIHAHFIFAYGYWGMKSGIHPLVLSAWGSDIAWVRDGSVVGRLTKDVIGRADLVHTGDSGGRTRLIELGCPPEKIMVQPWGVDLRNFTRSARSDGLRREILGGGEGVIATMVASLVPNWDVPTLVRSAPYVKAARKDLKILVVGGGPEKERLESLASELGVGDVVRFTGAIPYEKMPEYLSSSDMYIDTVPVAKAGIGMGASVMEALGAGLPVVLARRPGIETAVQDCANGYIFKARDPKDLAEKILKLASEPDIMARFGKTSRELALRIGDWDCNMKSFESAYMELVRRRKQ